MTSSHSPEVAGATAQDWFISSVPARQACAAGAVSRAKSAGAASGRAVGSVIFNRSASGPNRPLDGDVSACMHQTTAGRPGGTSHREPEGRVHGLTGVGRVIAGATCLLASGVGGESRADFRGRVRQASEGGTTVTGLIRPVKLGCAVRTGLPSGDWGLHPAGVAAEHLFTSFPATGLATHRRM
jgi:hypothetical protein